MSLQATYLDRLQSMSGIAKQVLKVTDHLLQARPALLADYISIAKSTGMHQVRVAHISFIASKNVACTYLLQSCPIQRPVPSMYSRSTKFHALHMQVLNSSHARAGSSGLMYAVLHFASQHPEQLASQRHNLLTFYSERVLGAKAVLPAETLHAYNPMLRSLTHEEFGKVVLPAVLKYVKRTPEPALSSTKALLSASQLDLSSYASDLVDQLLKLARGTKESVR